MRNSNINKVIEEFSHLPQEDKEYVAEIIKARLDAVEELMEEPLRLERLARGLREIPDLPRLLSRLALGAASPREMAALAAGLVKAGEIGPLLAGARSEALRGAGEASPCDVPAALGASVTARLVPDPPATAREGEIFRDGVDADVDALRALRRDASGLLSALEARERAERGVPTLRVKFNQVFGHVFEIPGSARAKIPEGALKRQTLSTVERYATAELIELDDERRSAEAKLSEREAELFRALSEEIVRESPAILGASSRLGRLDAFRIEFCRFQAAVRMIIVAETQIADQLQSSEGKQCISDIQRLESCLFS